MRAKLPDGLEALRARVVGCGIAVHRTLGPGLLESIYRDCLAIELRSAGFEIERERRVSVRYRGQLVGAALKVDIVVNGQLVVEVKAVEHLHPVFFAQVITYLKLTECPLGLLMNFNSAILVSSIR